MHSSLITLFLHRWIMSECAYIIFFTAIRLCITVEIERLSFTNDIEKIRDN